MNAVRDLLSCKCPYNHSDPYDPTLLFASPWALTVRTQRSRMPIFRQIWRDDSAVVVSIELILILTVLILGLIVGLATLRDKVVNELGDLAVTFGSLNQSFSLSGATGHHSSSAGSDFIDLVDDGDGPDTPGCEPACISVCEIPVDGEGN